MIKKPFFGIIKPKIEYERLGSVSAPREIPAPRQLTFFVEAPYERTDSLRVLAGQAVQENEKLLPYDGEEAYLVAAAGGKVADVFSHTGNFGEKFTGISIAVDEKAGRDEAFAAAAQTPSLENAAEFLKYIPGGLPASLLAEAGRAKTIVISGVDEDLLTMTRQYVVKNEMGDVKRGIDLIKKIFAVQKIVLAVPDNMVAEARAAGVEVEGVDMSYPAANPRMIAAKIAGQPIPAGTSCEEAGIFFVSAEAVASVARAYEARQIPQQKVITVIRKDGERSLVSALIGTPVGHVLEACSQEVSEGDRIVFGGPMKGMAVYTEAYPVRPDTDAIMVQDAGDIPGVSDRACVNCGECVRVCPARLPVNVLVRYLEAGEYAEAVDRCDLQSCIECGLCAFVCPARIPVFQYIKLGKYEFARLNAAEAENA